MDTQHLDIRGFVCVFVVFHALFCFSSEKYSDPGGELSLQQENKVGWGLSNPRGLQAALRFLAGQSLLTAGSGLCPSLEILASR